MIPLNEELKLRRQRSLAVAEALKAGDKVAVIAERFGMSPAYVSKIARQAGLGRYQKRRAHFPAIAAEYAAGVPVKAICEKFSVDRKTVWAAAVKQGVKLRKGRSDGGSVVGREGTGVSVMRPVPQPGHREPQHVEPNDPRSPLLSVPEELLHGRDDGGQVRGADHFTADLVAFGTAVARVNEDGTMTHVPLKDVAL